MQSSLTVRPTERTDLVEIAKLAEATGFFPADMLDAMIAGYLDGTSADIWLTALAEAQVVAFGFCEPERMTNGTWNLLAIAVVPTDQGKGIGARLVGQLEAVLRDAGHRILLVETAGTPEFERTRSFYRANGFEEQARIREFYDVGVDKIVFWKKV